MKQKVGGKEKVYYAMAKQHVDIERKDNRPILHEC
jgi:hypothetical protein